jgi:hypothetical protein
MSQNGIVKHNPMTGDEQDMHHFQCCDCTVQASSLVRWETYKTALFHFSPGSNYYVHDLSTIIIFTKSRNLSIFASTVNSRQLKAARAWHTDHSILSGIHFPQNFTFLKVFGKNMS